MKNALIDRHDSRLVARRSALLFAFFSSHEINFPTTNFMFDFFYHIFLNFNINTPDVYVNVRARICGLIAQTLITK